MSKKDLLAIPQITPDFGFDPDKNLIPYYSGSSSNANRDNVISGIEKQTMMMDAYAQKTKHALSKMSEINKHASDKFSETVVNTSRLKREARGKGHQTYVEQFSDAITQVAGQQMIGTVKIGAAAIVHEVGRYPYSAPEKKSGLRRLLGS